MFILILARSRNQFKNTEGKVITALPRSLLEEGRRRRADSTHQDGTSFPAQPCAGVQQRQGSSPPSLVTPKHFLKRSQIYSLDPCGLDYSLDPKAHVPKPECTCVRKGEKQPAGCGSPLTGLGLSFHALLVCQ